ncbi:putative nucleic acid-binding protein [Cryobacterium mesophilum]|uniref:Ribonuclease VapC n=1 Tax=Terrimesophilobacter mesophilus TaxID=433647 RepID=A0A4R8VB87_9MICO|nr:type II toxin-antitoxin system VapC family toxin [Terrimesophilobacter mesophilus]MBB5633329.1 putative nucleic acid-binding protein [Terrimesophilobacter mesophilus]TFB80063.1 PIN domain-containing protein [Terrimesophilobacter mesophilus]
MNLVIDCSAAIATIHDGAEPLRIPPANLYAPELIDVEYASAIRRFVSRRELSAANADRYIETWASTPIRRSRHLPLLPRIWQLRENISSYDAAYVALAERLAAPLVTADRRLARAASAYCEVITVDG